jgi:hypothetical protein
LKTINVTEKVEKTEVFQNVREKIQDLLRFKQIEKDRQYDNLRAKIREEEEKGVVVEVEDPVEAPKEDVKTQPPSRQEAAEDPYDNQRVPLDKKMSKSVS